MRFDTKIWSWLIGVAVVVAIGGTLSGQSSDARAGDIQAPAIGATFIFECSGSEPAKFVTYTVKSVDNDVATIEWASESDAGLIMMPLSTWYLGFTTEKTYGNHFRNRKIESGTLSFEKLEVGERVKAWVRQFDSRWGKNRWRWTAEIKERLRVEVEVLGPLDVYVIEQELYSSEWNFGATLTIHYSPEVHHIVYWHESDTNKREEECRLVSVE